jgi:hypothetical protein
MSDLEQVELEITEARRLVQLRNTFRKLQEHSAFKEVFDDGYFRDHAIALVYAKGDFSMSAPDRQKALDNDIMAIGSLRTYLNSIIQQGNMAEQSLNELEKAQTDILEEDL